MSPVPIRPAVDVPLDVLQGLTHALRAELLRRGEFLPSPWVEEAAEDLRAGRLAGWVSGPGTDGDGLAFLSARPGRGYGHIHVGPGPDALARSEALLDALRGTLGPDLGRIDVGITGLAASDEDRLREGAARRPGDEAIVRYALERPVLPPPAAGEWPPHLHRTAVGDVDLGALALLDWSAFQGTDDAELIADTVAGDRRILEEIVGGLLGRFLDEASCVLLDAEGRPAALLFTAEESARSAVFLDLAVRPSERRRGLGAALIGWGLRALAALGHERVRLWVTESNAPARALYARSGFVAAGRAIIYRLRVPSTAAGVAQPQRSR